MERSYTLGHIQRSPRGAIKAKLLEDGSIIASVTRPAPGRWILPFVVNKFYSQAAKARFDDFCGCLTMGETIDAISAGEPALEK